MGVSSQFCLILHRFIVNDGQKCLGVKKDNFLVRHSQLMTKNERKIFTPKLGENLGVKRGVKVKKSSKTAEGGKG